MHMAAIKRTFFSQHVHLNDAYGSILDRDIELFNRMVRTATAWILADERRKLEAKISKKQKEEIKRKEKKAKKETEKKIAVKLGPEAAAKEKRKARTKKARQKKRRQAHKKPDLRKKENAALKNILEGSIDVRLRKKFPEAPYWVARTVVNVANANIKSASELLAVRKQGMEDRIKEIKGKKTDTERRLKELEKTKSDLIAISKTEKKNRQDIRIGKKPSAKVPELRMPSGGFETYDQRTGKVMIWGTKRKTGRYVKQTYANTYLFEVQYLDPLIKQKKQTIAYLGNKIQHLEAVKEKLHISICYGTKKLWRKQNTVFYCDPEDDKEKHDRLHAEWLRAFRKARNRGLAVNGRYDLAGGNYAFHYAPDIKTVWYNKSANEKEPLGIPVQFGYGDDWIRKAVLHQDGWEKASTQWRVEKTGGSYIFKCCIDMQDEPARKNEYYGSGCVGMDLNVDRIAVAEVDGKGNLLWHDVIYFALDGKTSEQREQILSHALEKVFARCSASKKPLVMEDLKDVIKTKQYGQKALNRVLASFSYKIMGDLAGSKSWKYSVGLKKINPAYTSQTGKVKYMSMYGLSVHEAAAFVIARRGMGFIDQAPRIHRELTVPKELKQAHPLTQWKVLYSNKNIKEAEVKDFYTKKPLSIYRYPDKVLKPELLENLKIVSGQG